ncbi:hypothetical protein EON62_02070 [archaeon]|nr:MAG: hypothetical protein EON62_02070 [archaeon]
MIGSASFKRVFFELKGKALSKYKNAEVYKQGAVVKPEDALDVTQFVMLEALEVLGTGPSYAKTSAIDAGRTITLQPVNAASGAAGMWLLRAADTTVRNEWARAILGAGCAQPALVSA